MKKAGIAALGALGLVLAGAFAGTLFAPDKGERIRRKIARKGRQIFHSSINVYEEGMDRLQALRDELRDHLEEVDDEIGKTVKARCE